MTSPIDPNSFGFLFADIARLMRAEMDRLTASAGIGLTPGEARTLAHAARAGAVRQAVLAERMGVEAMTISVFLDRLEERGLVVRDQDPADGRAKLVRLTPAADAALAAVAEISAAVRGKAMGHLSQDELEALRTLLTSVRARLCAPAGQTLEEPMS